MPGMGFRHSVDPRDNNYPMRLRLDPFLEKTREYFPKGLPTGTRHYKTGHGLNQGETGTCCWFCATHRIHAAPVMQQLPINPATGNRLTPFDGYRITVGDDEYPDNDYEVSLPDDQLQMGTSVRGTAETMRKLGIIKNYLHAGSVEDMRAWHLAGFGGQMNGTTWKTDMFKPDSEGFVSATGNDEGGHAYASCGWNDTAKHNGRVVRAMLCQQSWGSDWGLNGFFWIEEGDIEKLFADGEFIAPVEVRVEPRAKPITTAWDYTRTDKKPANPEPY